MYDENLIHENGLLQKQDEAINTKRILSDKLRLVRKKALPYVMIAPSQLLVPNPAKRFQRFWHIYVEADL